MRMEITFCMCCNCSQNRKKVFLMKNEKFPYLPFQKPEYIYPLCALMRKCLICSLSFILSMTNFAEKQTIPLQ